MPDQEVMPDRRVFRVSKVFVVILGRKVILVVKDRKVISALRARPDRPDRLDL